MENYAIRFKGNIEDLSPQEIDFLNEALKHEKNQNSDIVFETRSGLRYIVCAPTAFEYVNRIRTIKPVPVAPSKPVVKRRLTRAEIRTIDETWWSRFIERT